MTAYCGVIGNRDFIKLGGQRRPFWEFLDQPPDGWLSSLVYARNDVPTDRPRIWDCGAWSYRDAVEPQMRGERVNAAWAWARYQEFARPGDRVIAPDHMLIPGSDLAARRTYNREQAARFLDLAGRSDLVPVAVAHGADIDERLDALGELVRLGYRNVALGGLAGRTAQRAYVLETVAACRWAYPQVWLHVLGVSAPNFFRIWQQLGVDSCDGASHFKQAFSAGRFFVAEGGRLVAHQAVRPGEVVTAPLCVCRACTLLRAEGVDTRQYGSNESNMGRAAHNLNQLILALRAPEECLCGC